MIDIYIYIMCVNVPVTTLSCPVNMFNLGTPRFGDRASYDIHEPS